MVAEGNVQIRFTVTEEMLERIEALTAVMGLPSSTNAMATGLALGVMSLEEKFIKPLVMKKLEEMQKEYDEQMVRLVDMASELEEQQRQQEEKVVTLMALTSGLAEAG